MALRVFISFPYTNFSINNVNAGATIPKTVVFAIDVNFKAPNQKIKCIANDAPAKYTNLEFLGLIGLYEKKLVYSHKAPLAIAILQNAITVAGT